jgi:hypothetical protein
MSQTACWYRLSTGYLAARPRLAAESVPVMPLTDIEIRENKFWVFGNERSGGPPSTHDL